MPVARMDTVCNSPGVITGVRGLLGYCREPKCLRRRCVARIPASTPEARSVQRCPTLGLPIVPRDVAHTCSCSIACAVFIVVALRCCLMFRPRHSPNCLFFANTWVPRTFPIRPGDPGTDAHPSQYHPLDRKGAQAPLERRRGPLSAQFAILQTICFAVKEG